MTFQQKVSAFFRSNNLENQAEIERLYDLMQEEEPGTEEYLALEERYLELTDRDIMREEVRAEASTEWGKILAAFGGIIAYRALFDKTGDPFFKDFGGKFLRFIKGI